MTTHPLSLRDITVTFGEGARTVTALRDVSLDLNPGELVAVMGPSGVGKSTLLNVAGLLMHPGEGEVLIDGTSTTDISAATAAELRRTHIGVVFQRYNMLPTLTVGENVSLPLEMDGTDKDTCRLAAREALEEVGLGGLEDRFPDEISGGQAQRAAIARALIGKRSILLADEPTGALDSATADEVMRVLRRRIDSGACGMVVTHEPRLAAYADRMVLLRDGTITKD